MATRVNVTSYLPFADSTYVAFTHTTLYCRAVVQLNYVKGFGKNSKRLATVYFLLCSVISFPVSCDLIHHNYETLSLKAAVHVEAEV